MRLQTERTAVRCSVYDQCALGHSTGPECAHRGTPAWWLELCGKGEVVDTGQTGIEAFRRIAGGAR